MLSSCYRASLDLAVQNRLRSIAFPSISTGVYGYPHRLAAEVAVRAVRAYITNNSFVENVVFCCYSDDNLQDYQDLLALR